MQQDNAISPTKEELGLHCIHYIRKIKIKTFLSKRYAPPKRDVTIDP